ncbi:TPA: lipoprotein-releasing ABC transporter ATP-binding protein LolD [Legionella pneumophila subsp. pneumophila]|uniref:lipoprotein-releasing ABC transporter ATP-binding protein LolD n=1 Tax=Legionella pneumophila TaxID=446 RepID=UPI0001E3C19F|nr:lipoprotein-releasing ABC transporter ATP-binding protein LolD [Legionella pneumophila]AMV15105.1 Lipoprotein-releasing system ATP-binding protein LolD [Legionella pneumophila]ANN93258.1 lipoprotein releasing system, ATP-binding protein [Legionella pneumophila]MCZ4680278.1 lipoprotein-releasing ABC transporter ATP-binding protein LolD [Legionella pneumophila]MCZ4702460.1 lipoprotein-releasing ABC transporter ATP-binding protein LolD [Legionella pneumophila]MCZ4749883.1 lipoprotein-releasing
MNDTILTSQKLYKSYHDGTSTVEVLKGVDLAITKGDRIAIIGPSGSGKSTLLHLLGGLDKPTSGLITLGNVNWQKINEKQRCQLRNQQLGFVYQFHHLLPEFTALENVMMPLLLAGMAVKDAEEKAINMLEQVGLKPRLTHKPAQLSGGERQRVAIARALVHQPHCVLADEPTGNLDEATASKVFDLMLELNKKMNTALVIVTHDQRIAERMDRVLVLHEGSLYARE